MSSEPARYRKCLIEGKKLRGIKSVSKAISHFQTAFYKVLLVILWTQLILRKLKFNFIKIEVWCQIKINFILKKNIFFFFLHRDDSKSCGQINWIRFMNKWISLNLWINTIFRNCYLDAEELNKNFQFSIKDVRHLNL